MRPTRFIYMSLVLAMLAACSPKTTPSTTATSAPTAMPVPPTSTPKPANENIEIGFTAEGWPYRGNANAAVTLWEYTEFQ